MPWAFRSAVAALPLWAALGCVERRMTVRSNPSGALVVLDGQEIGFTPVSVGFTYYGVREIKLVKDGYETRVIRQRVAAPWYQAPGVDFVAEALVPVRIRDERDYGGDVYTLEPKATVPQEQLIERANEVRAQASQPPPRALKRAKVENFQTDPGATAGIGNASPAVPSGPAALPAPAPMVVAPALVLPPAPAIDTSSPPPTAAPKEPSIPAPRNFAIPPAPAMPPGG